ncbi:MAG: endolytic transglycosylase MltG [Pseudolabrys sp.]
MPEPVIRRSQRAKHPLIVAGNAIFSILAVVALAAGGAVFYGKQKMEEPGPLSETKTVTISRGLGIKDISDLLAREGVIDQPAVFVGGAMLLKLRGDGLKFGEYEFQKQASLGDVLDTISEGKIVQHTFSVPEGLTSEQIVARLLESDLLTGNIKEIPREGTLLPETYKINRGTPREQIIQRMQQAHRRVLQEVWERRNPDLPVKTPEQLVVLASIIEKETGRADERSRVASVFVNRLKNRMRLQSDPTIIYGLSGGKGTLGRPILRSEIDQPTPYNTYVIDGLPPGPIANPGRASLEAAANPARTKELYFVADGTGGHVFSENYEQHQKNVAKLRALERDAAPAATPAPATPPASGLRGSAR